MKHFLLSVLCLLLTVIAPAQSDRMFIVSPTPLYLTPQSDKAPLGTLLRGAKVWVMPQGRETGDFVKVEVYKGFSGYVAANSFRKSLNAADTYSPSPAPVIEQDNHYGSPHLFSLVAGLRSRDGVGPTARVVKIYTTGEAVPVEYLPRRADDYVVIRTDWDRNPELVQRQYLGPLPALSEYLARYDAVPATDLKNRRLWAERAMELAWNSGDPTAKTPAMKRFLSVARDLKDPTLIANAELSLLLAQTQDNRLPYEAVAPLMAPSKTYGILQGHRLPDSGLRYTQVMEWLGKPQQQNRITDDDCGVYIGDQMLLYPSAEVTADVKQDLADVIRMNLQDPKNAFVINNTRVDATTSEMDFVRTHGRLLWGSGLHPHHYHLPMNDYTTLIFVFKNGRPLECYWVVQC